MNEIVIVEAINTFGRGTILDLLSIGISQISIMTGFWTILTLSVFLVDRQRGKYALVAVLLATVLHFLVSEGLIKEVIMPLLLGERTRPYLAHPDRIVPLGEAFTDSSFPSSHMASTVSLVMVYIHYYRKLLIPGIIAVLIMALSRIHNGMHYPTDIVGGILIGLCYGWVTLSLLKAIFAKSDSRHISS